MKSYPFHIIEPKWQEFWETHEVFKVTEDPSIAKEKRKYVLDMFPYPSAAGLHVGHPEGYTATDIHCRFLRMKGFHVLHPMGFDSFGLPAENYAIQTGTHPKTITEENISRFRKQIKRLGFSYDWSREVATHTVEYYRWTQWIFLQLYKKGLAYQAQLLVWYCPALGTVLANEEVLNTEEGPRSERGNHPVERRAFRQWLLKITQYAERLLDGLHTLDWPESIKTMQRNWIGRSEGSRVSFCIAHTNDVFSVFTTRVDTLYGASYVVLAPEHSLVQKICSPQQRDVVNNYIDNTRIKSDLDRTALSKEKSGVFTGAYAIHPLTKEKLPIWIADYVLASYGSGAVMAVPAHDERDWEFAKKHKLPIVQVIQDEHNISDVHTHAYTKDGVLINSAHYDGMHSKEARKAITNQLIAQKMGEFQVHYKLRDWLFSRQRYWGEPIPLVHTKDGNIIALDENDIPLTLPETDKYLPSGTGESPLSTMTEWMHFSLPDGTPVTRESNTMPQWAGSCWYYLRYLDPKNTEVFASREKINYWMPVDLYLGGAEHAVLHLLYARFWHMVLYDLGLVNTKEPFQRLINQGMILGEDNNKMSKSLGNVINPDHIIDEYGADSLRMYEMFMGPLTQNKPWSTKGLIGVHRFLTRIWHISEKPLNEDAPPSHLIKSLHKTIKKVSNDNEQFLYNTAIAQMMIFINILSKETQCFKAIWDPFIRLLAPYAPHMAEELWQKIGNTSSITYESWPSYNEELTTDDEVEVVFQINGKVRAKKFLPKNSSKEELENHALKSPQVQQYLKDHAIKKTIIVPNKIVNFVI